MITEYDAIIIGSSPISLIEAYVVSRTGARVAILEKGTVVGGGWQTRRILGFDNVEIGCHIFWHRNFNVNKGYEVFKRLGIHLLEMSPQPMYEINNYFLNKVETPRTDVNLYFQEWKQSVRQFRRIKDASSMKAIIRFTVLLVYKVIQSILSPNKNPWKYKYPNGGSGEMLKKILKKIECQDIDLLLECEAINISEQSEYLCVNTSRGRFITKKISLTSGISLDFIQNIAGKKIKIPYKRKKLIHIALLIKDSVPTSFSFVRVHEKYIKMASDISQYVKPKISNQEKVILLNIEPKLLDLDSYLDILVKDLKRIRLISSNASIINHELVSYTGCYINPKDFAEVSSKLPTNMKMVFSSNFMGALSLLSDEWISALD